MILSRWVSLCKSCLVPYPRNPEIRERKGSCGISLIRLLWAADLYDIYDQQPFYK